MDGHSSVADVLSFAFLPKRPTPSPVSAEPEVFGPVLIGLIDEYAAAWFRIDRCKCWRVAGLACHEFRQYPHQSIDAVGRPGTAPRLPGNHLVLKAVEAPDVVHFTLLIQGSNGLCANGLATAGTDALVGDGRINRPQRGLDHIPTEVLLSQNTVGVERVICSNGLFRPPVGRTLQTSILQDKTMGFGRSLARASTNSGDNNSAFSATARWINSHHDAGQRWKLVDPSIVEFQDGPQRARHFLQVLSHNLLPVREAGHVATDFEQRI